MRAFSLLLLFVLSAALLTSLFYPKVQTVTVEGHEHHSAASVQALAQVTNGATPFLWVTHRSVRGLLDDPWVHSAAVVKRWPDHVSIAIRERQPELTDGVRTWANDGTVLLGATAEEASALPKLNGWGEERTLEALAILSLLKPYGVQVISYTPEGFEILLDDSELFTPGVDALREQWSAFLSHSGGRIAIYPWGVSKANE